MCCIFVEDKKTGGCRSVVGLLYNASSFPPSAPTTDPTEQKLIRAAASLENTQNVFFKIDKCI